MKRCFLLIVILLISGIVQTPAAPQDFPFTGVVTADNVNVRAGQDNSFDRLGVLKKDDRVTVVGKSFSWYKIKLPEQARCYVSRKLVHFLRDGIGEINGNRVNIRAKADLNGVVVGQLNELTKVKVIETVDDWYRISPVEGLYGWVFADFIDFQSKDVAPPVVVQLPSKNIYALKRQEEERKRAEEEQLRAEEEKRKVTLTGIVRLLAQSPEHNVRHQVTDENGQTYYLMGYRSVIDSFLNQRVHVEGITQLETNTAYPVLLVTRVSLVF